MGYLCKLQIKENVFNIKINIIKVKLCIHVRNNL